MLPPRKIQVALLESWSMSSASAYPGLVFGSLRPPGPSCCGGASSVLPLLQFHPDAFLLAACSSETVPAPGTAAWPAPLPALCVEPARKSNLHCPVAAAHTFPTAGFSTHQNFSLSWLRPVPRVLDSNFHTQFKFVRLPPNKTSQTNPPQAVVEE